MGDNLPCAWIIKLKNKKYTTLSEQFLNSTEKSQKEAKSINIIKLIYYMHGNSCVRTGIIFYNFIYQLQCTYNTFNNKYDLKPFVT